jgi:hypothetical protein
VETKITVRDCEDFVEVYGILTIRGTQGMTFSEMRKKIEQTAAFVREYVEDWNIQDIMDALKKKGIDCVYEELPEEFVRV